MATRRVFVVWRHPLFYDSVRLLLRHPEVVLVGETTDLAATEAEITSLEPDVVIIEEAETESESGGLPLTILRRGPKVICMNLDNNELSIYQRQARLVGSGDELIQLVLGRSPSLGTGEQPA